VFRNNPHVVEELKGKLTTTVESITKETVATVMDSSVDVSKCYWMHRDHIFNVFT
jgi:hypothetical protein